MNLLPLPNPQAPIKSLERLWLDTAFLYEELNEMVMVDTDWDAFAKGLQEREPEWSPYFRHCLPTPDYNVGTTASGIDWTKGVPLNVVTHLVGLQGLYTSLHRRHHNCFQ